MTLLNLAYGHRIPGLPVVVANAWRVGVWAAMALLIGAMLQGMPGRWARRDWPYRTLLGMTALLVFTLRAAVDMAERWNSPALWEGLPPTTLAVGLAVASWWAGRRNV